MDRLQERVASLAAKAAEAREDAALTFGRIRALADEAREVPSRPSSPPPPSDRRRAPRLSEAWFC